MWHVDRGGAFFVVARHPVVQTRFLYNTTPVLLEEAHGLSAEDAAFESGDAQIDTSEWLHADRRPMGTMVAAKIVVVGVRSGSKWAAREPGRSHTSRISRWGQC